MDVAEEIDERDGCHVGVSHAVIDKIGTAHSLYQERTP
ncbi:hypothetical protein BDK88_2258 [Natrinema hispanicum]|uniref:Uncharacterized protein n=1 Tax=Natrinema hispanicum TaxID=392421 RepID=A0A482Y940_9EURY|nr:hypothetical protein BDK88_2258 [Natrinema hispanicum]